MLDALKTLLSWLLTLACLFVGFSMQHPFSKVAPTDNASLPGAFQMMENFVAYVKGAADTSIA